MKLATPLGLAAITPSPLDPVEIAGLVERTRVNSTAARAHRIVIAGAASGQARPTAFRMTPSRIAAHLIAFTGWSLSRAAAVVTEMTRMQLSISGVHHAYLKLYPERRLYAKRPGVTLAAFKAGAR